MVMNIIFNALDMLFAPIIALDPTSSNPLLTVFLISTLIAFITTLANKLLVDQDEMNKIRNEIKDFQTEMREAQKSGDVKEIAKMQKKQQQFMSKQTKMMKMSFKPLIVTFIPILLVFYWMGQSAVSKVIVSLPEFVYWGTLTPVWQWLYSLLGYGISTVTIPEAIPLAVGWFSWYLLCTFAMTQVLRKAMGLNSGSGF